METAAGLWNGLRSEFRDLSETELRSALGRTQHHQLKEVRTLKEVDARVKEWLARKEVNPSQVYQWDNLRKKSAYVERYTERRLEEKWRRLVEIKNELLRSCEIN